jgi:hypothetical protein
MYKFVQGFVGHEFQYKPRDLLTGTEFDAATIERLLDRGIIVQIGDAPIARAPVKEKAVSRKAAKAEKTIL